MGDVLDIKPSRLVVDSAAPLRLAELYLRTHHTGPGGKCLLVRWRGNFYRYSGGRYGLVTNEDIDVEVYDLLDRVDVRVFAKDAGQEEKRRLSASMRLVQEVRQALVGRVFRVTGDEPLWINDVEGPRSVIALPNGILNLATGEFSPPTPDYFTLHVAGTVWDPYAPPPTEWLSFLQSVWPKDPLAITSLQQMFGYLLSTDTNLQKMFLLVGPARSGKGTIARVLRALIGAEAVANPTLGALGNNFGLAPLLGKKVAIIGDARLGGRADMATILERLLSLSGEDALTVDRKYQEAVTGRLGARIVIITNELPAFRDTASAFASRFVIIPTLHSFLGREDLFIEQRIMPELPGILQWAFEGYRSLMSTHVFVQSADGKQVSEDLTRIGSPVRAFVDECCVRGPYETSATDLFKRWCTWCEDAGQEPGTVQRFGASLRAVLPGLEVVRRSKAKTRYYVGIGIADERSERLTSR